MTDKISEEIKRVPMSMVEFATKFRDCFPDLGPANTFLDVHLSVLRGSPSLDPIKLDDSIIAKHGEYEGSMKEFVGFQYGAKAVVFILQAM